MPNIPVKILLWCATQTNFYPKVQNKKVSGLIRFWRVLTPLRDRMHLFKKYYYVDIKYINTCPTTIILVLERNTLLSLPYLHKYPISVSMHR